MAGLEDGAEVGEVEELIPGKTVLQAELEGMLELVLRVWSEGLFHGELKSEVRLRGHFWPDLARFGHVWPWFWARAGVRQAVGCRRQAVDRKWEVLLRGGPEPRR